MSSVCAEKEGSIHPDGIPIVKIIGKIKTSL
jgi:hypothetical protein